MNRYRFRQIMADRREFKRKGWDYEYITHTAVAWKYLLNIKRVPPNQWDAIVSEKMAHLAYEEIKQL